MLIKCRRKKAKVSTIVYDNGGETTDRYTVFIGKDVYSMSRNPLSPQGFNQYAGTRTQIKPGKHLGKKLTRVPQKVKQAICQRA